MKIPSELKLCLDQDNTATYFLEFWGQKCVELGRPPLTGGFGPLAVAKTLFDHHVLSLVLLYIRKKFVFKTLINHLQGELWALSQIGQKCTS